jgi:hypothetical protein
MTVVTKTSGDGNGAKGNLSSAISSKSRKSGIYGPQSALMRSFKINTANKTPLLKLEPEGDEFNES